MSTVLELPAKTSICERQPRLVIVSSIFLSVTLAAGCFWGYGSRMDRLKGLDRARSPQAKRDNLPLAFEPNLGQAGPDVDFLSRSATGSLAITATRVELAFWVPPKEPRSHDVTATHNSQPSSAVIAMRVVGGNSRTEPVTSKRLPGVSNYLVGNNVTKWRSNIPHFGQITYPDVYPGIDLTYYGNLGRLEYDFVLHPGAQPDQIRLAFEGAGNLNIDSSGDLIAIISGYEIRQHPPKLYQWYGNVQKEVAGHYVLEGSQVALKVASFDRDKTLIVDPILEYSTFLGGSGNDRQGLVAIDTEGNAYVAGTTQSTDFRKVGAVQTNLAGGSDIFVSKLNPAGTALSFSTYLGGSGNDVCYGISLDLSGNVYVTGYTQSQDFPTSVNSFQRLYSGTPAVFRGIAFVVKLAAAGNQVLYSTFLGGTGNDQGNAIAVDQSGNAYVVGVTTSSDFPMMNPVQRNLGGSSDAFVSKLDPNGSSLLYSTYIGGSAGGTDPGADEALGVALSPLGEAFIVGNTQSTDFPVLNAVQTKSAGGKDIFVLALNPSGTSIEYSTYLGGSGDDVGTAIALDSTGAAYITGSTSSVDFPTLRALQPNLQGSTDALVVKVAPLGGSLVFSTYLGGTRYDKAFAIAVDGGANVYIGGETSSTDFPPVNALQATNAGGYDAFIVKVAASGGQLLFASYFGGISDDSCSGISIDSKNNIYLTGTAAPSFNFPKGPVPSFPFGGGTSDVFAAKLANADLALTVISSPTSVQSTQRRPRNALAKGGDSVVKGGSADPGGTWGLVAMVTSLGTALNSSTAENPTVNGQLSQGLQLVTCMFGGTSCMGPNNTIQSPRGLSLPPNSDLQLNLSAKVDGSMPVGTQVSVRLYAQSDTNDPNEANNYATISATLGTPVNVSTAPVGGLRITFDGVDQTTPFTKYIDAVARHTVCAPSPQTVNGTTYIFSDWLGQTDNCQRNQQLIGGTITATFTPCAFSLPSNAFSAGYGSSASTVSLTATIGCPWSATSNVPWITITSGNSGTGTGTVGYTVSANTWSAKRTGVLSIGNQSLTVVQSGLPLPSFGFIDLPHDNTTGVTGAIAVTGWGLSSIGIANVQFWREPVAGEATASNGLVYIEAATIIPGTRPDVAAAYPGYPNNTSGWGGLILTNEVPNNNGTPGVGNGTYRIHVLATDLSGLTSELGVRTIVTANASAILPFGTIDTPDQGATVSGSAYVNFGWVLTPNPANVIPKDGSTITIYIDNRPVGHPVYNNNRSDISSLFPGLQNSNGAVGFFRLDTTKLLNGLHTISWSATDSAGNSQGLGSRFFTVKN